MRLLFLTANEQLDSGLLQSQLVRPVQAHLGDTSAIINLHRPMTNRFRSDCVQTFNFPILIPFRFINFRETFFLNDVICLFYALAIALRTLSQLSSSTLVCRGYVPGLVGWWLNRLLGVPYIFDPRSLYVHEHVGSGSIKEGSVIQRYWLSIERRVVRRAVRTVCVSKGMVNYYEGLGVSRNGPVVIIPCFATAQNPLPEQERTRIRQQHGYADSDLVIAYYGSLNDGWNNLKMYSEFFQAAGAVGAKVLIISQDAMALKQSELGCLPFVRIMGGPGVNPDAAAALLGAADYGVVLMGEVPDWETRLSVKFAEYTCGGLPVIVGKFVGEAARLVRANDLKPSLILEGTIRQLPLRKATSDERDRIRSWATSYFSNRNIMRLISDDS
ncbi:MAG: glycosyltransferase [Betaproteobacteria bacterium]